MSDADLCPECGGSGFIYEPPNRWAAFTEAEMFEIQSCMGYAEQNHPAKVNEEWERIMGETNAELERRKA